MDGCSQIHTKVHQKFGLEQRIINRFNTVYCPKSKFNCSRSSWTAAVKVDKIRVRFNEREEYVFLVTISQIRNNFACCWTIEYHAHTVHKRSIKCLRVVLVRTRHIAHRVSSEHKRPAIT